MTLLQIMTALIVIETGGHPNPNNAIGDNGKAWGILQMHEAYVTDAAQYANVSWTHADALDPSKAKEIFVAYMSRYAQKKNKPYGMTYAEYVSRKHNGGPTGHLKESTISYWLKVKEALQLIYPTLQQNPQKQ